MPTGKTLLTLVVFLFVIGACPLVYGQATGIISGTVTDASGSAVAGAKVVVTAPAMGVTRDSTTDESGHFLVPLLPVGSFTVRVEFTGFQPAEEKDIRLQVDEHREVDFKLFPASVKESVEVTATAVAVETANPTLGQVITSQQVAELPLNGRDFVQLATLTPGTISETNPQSFFNGGARQRGFGARLLFAFGGRIPRQHHRLAVRRQRQQRTDRGRHRHSAFASTPSRNSKS